MIIIELNKNIEWSVDDSFLLSVTSDIGFNEGDKLKFEITKSENEEPIISKEFSLAGDCFDIEFDAAERKKLAILCKIW